ncbi:retinol dehydrogenase 12-like isoform X2 [Macrobrachium nipponense]|uniref:retinol dehydrogenase 12-like isoform X2 n=1 Tax=Macrobrachium nipponense TaxID=159736 RepID=UPI0030C8620E
MDRIRGSVLNFNWVTVEFFTQGWDYFFRLEGLTLVILCTLVGVVDYLRGNELSCMLTHWALIVLVRRFMVGGICTSGKRVDGKTVVITGCNVGIGKETALELSRRGAKIIMACRDTKKAEKVALEIERETGGEVVVMKLDLASLTSIRTFAGELKTKEKMIHMLINNAGIMMCPFMKTEDGFEMQMGTNHFGHFLLTNLLLPLLTHSEPARIITLSSLAHLRGTIPFDDMNYEKGYDRIQAYGNSKVANVLFTRHLAKKVKGTNITVFSVHPGAVQSELARHIGGDILKYFMPFFVKKTAEGMQTTLYCALEAEQDDEHYYFSDCQVSYASSYARSDETAKKLWDLSEKMVGLSS